MSEDSGPIPNWDASGHLPLFVGNPVARGGSPYATGLIDLTLRFGTTNSRRRLLEGFLAFRASLHSAGVQRGFQWIDGSFVEDPSHHPREPKDIDVVTFFYLPTDFTQRDFMDRHGDLFKPPLTKERFRVDSYPVVLDTSDLSLLVSHTVYWNRLWSHGRQSQPKGYLQVDLSDSDDAAAKAVLANPADQGVPE